MRSLQTRVALAALVAVAATLLVVLLLVVSTFASSEREQLDRQVRRSADAAARAAEGRRPVGAPPSGVPAGALPGLPGGPPPGGGPPGDGPRGAGPDLRRRLDDTIARNGEFARVVTSGGTVLASSSAPAPAAGFPAPTRTSEVQTVRVGGAPYRVLSLPVTARSGAETVPATVQVAAPAGEVESRIDDLRTRVLVVGLLGLLLAGALAFALSRLALRALTRLRERAGALSGVADPEDRLPRGGPTEVDELAGTLNAMLDRVAATGAEREAALEASRQFAADVGHELRTPLSALGTNLQTLRAHPETAEREDMLAELTAEHARMAALLEALQALARADAAEAVPREPVDVADVADAAVQAAGRRHPNHTFTLAAPADEDAVVHGWPDGLRIAIDNLVENGARHGRANGVVATSVERRDGEVVVTVDDDGPGIPPEERRAVLQRFTRGRSAQGTGSGLGLALVARQAALHGGAIEISQAPLGGARLQLRFPTT